MSDSSLNLAQCRWHARLTYNAPAKHHNRNPRRRPHELKHDVARHFKQGVSEEEDHEHNLRKYESGKHPIAALEIIVERTYVVFVANEMQIVGHACDGCVANITSVQKRHDIEEGEQWNQTEIHHSKNTLCLLVMVLRQLDLESARSPSNTWIGLTNVVFSNTDSDVELVLDTILDVFRNASVLLVSLDKVCHGERLRSTALDGKDVGEWIGRKPAGNLTYKPGYSEHTHSW